MKSVAKPIDLRLLPSRLSMILSSPSKAPPQTNRMLVVLIWMKSWWGCLRPPWGGTLATVPSMILRRACCTPFAGDVAGDGGVVALAGDLVDLVDVDDAPLGALDVVVGGLDEVEEDVLHVLADVAGLGEGGGVGDGEGDVEDARQGAGEEGLAGAGGADEEDVGLLELDVGGGLAGGADALVVVVDGDAEDLLGLLLADDPLAELLTDVLGRGDTLGAGSWP